MSTNIIRNYKMSDDKLLAATNRVMIGAKRDLAHLEAYGFSQDDLDTLVATKLEFVEMPSDVELSAMMAEATAAKNQQRAAAIAYVMKEVMIRVELRFGAGSAEYARFGVATMHNMTDAELVLLLHHVHRLALRLLPELVVKGMTAELVAGVAQAVTDLVALLMAQADAVEDRDRAVDLRVSKGNQLYALVVELAEVGKRLWFNVSGADYNEYLIYRRTARPKAEEVETEVAPASAVTLSVRALRANTPMEVENTGTTPLTVHFGAMPTDVPTESRASILLAPGQSWRGNAAGLGYAAGKFTYLNAINPSQDLTGKVMVLAG